MKKALALSGLALFFISWLSICQMAHGVRGLNASEPDQTKPKPPAVDAAPTPPDDRWMLFTAHPGVDYYYDTKSITWLTMFIVATGRETGTAVKIWVKEVPQDGKASMKRWFINCTERQYSANGSEYGTIDIEPGSAQEDLFNKVCSTRY